MADRKSLDNLVQSLPFTKKSDEPRKDKTSNSPRSNNMRSGLVRKNTSTKRRGKTKFTTPVKEANKITKWFKKDAAINATRDCQMAQCSQTEDIPQSPGKKKVPQSPGKEKKISRSPGKQKVPQSPEIVKYRKKKGGTTLTRTNSEEKYGARLPSIEDFNANQRKLERNLAVLKDIRDNINYETKPSACIVKPDSTKNKKFKSYFNCKHLSSEEINEGFQKHYNHLDDIQNSRVHFDRKEKFKKSKLTDDNDLICTSYCYVYSQEQKSHMLDLLDEAFNSDNQAMGKYFLQVLLPELCLLLFMDEYEMARKQAIEYLDQIPIE